MKNVLFLVFSILAFVNNIEAQRDSWHYRDCHVLDINNCTQRGFECLWKSTTTGVRIGYITTAIGAGITAAGILAIRGAMGEWESYFIHIFITIPGVSTLLTGIIIWTIYGNHRQMLKETPNYDPQKFGSIRVSPNIRFFQFNNSYNYGVTLSFNF